MDNRVITGSCNVGSFNNFNNFNNFSTTITDDRNQVLQWLSSLDPQRRHQHIRESRLNGTGNWIFQTSEFRRWNTTEDGSSHSVLFCHGDPGVGKTHLSSLVIDHFYGSEQDITVVGLYCDYLDRKEQTTSNILGAMLKQLIGSGNVPGDIRKAFEDAKRHFGGVGSETTELLKMLKVVIAQRKWVVICIDGLDESFEAHRTSLLSALQVVVREMPNVRLFLTGRPFIRPEVERYFPTVDTILVSPTREDTEAFLRMKLDRDSEPDAMDESLREEIMEIIPKTISEIFLLVSLCIETILGETTIRRRKEKLKQITNGQDVGDVYTTTFERIRAQNKDRARLGMEAIMWIAYSEQPLEPDELCQALGVVIGSTDLDSDNAPSIRTVLNCGLGLVTVDSSSCQVRLVHFTLQEYILSHPTLFCSPHSTIAEVCLTYLNFGCIKELPPDRRQLPPTTPFLEYASRYWAAHARRQTSTRVISLALELIYGFNAHISSKLLIDGDEESGPWDGEYHEIMGPTALHAGAIFGVLEIMVSLLKMDKWNLNATDWYDRTALMWASIMGHDAIVKVLLEQEGVGPDIADYSGRTPLSFAAGKGYEGVVEMLLKRSDVSLDTADGDGRTPLSFAAGKGCGEVVRMLLERNEVNPNAAGYIDGRTPLSWAARNGNWEVVRVLLEWGKVNPDAIERGGRTPLSSAAEYGCGEVVRVLLERNDVNPSAADDGGRTPLSRAAENGHWEIVRMLLEREEVNPNTMDRGGRTPLSWAAGLSSWSQEGRDRVVKTLLERNDVDPDIPDKSGRTPLSRAAKYGFGEVVRMLLERNDVNPDKADNRGRTPLLMAAWYRKGEIVEMLIQRNDVNPNIADESGRTLFSWACEGRCPRTVRALLELNHVNPDAVDMLDSGL